MPKPNHVLEELSKSIAAVGIEPGVARKLTPKEAKPILEIFNSVDDGRVKSMCDYPLHEVLLLVFMGVLAGCNQWTQLERFGKDNLMWLRKFYPYSSGTPSHDEIQYIFGKIPNEQFQTLIVNYLAKNIEDIRRCLKSNESSNNLVHYAIDGKEENGTGRSYCASQQGKVQNQQTLHVWDVTNGICLYSEAIEEKTNEIPVAQKFLRSQKSLDGILVTFDALHTQTATWKLILSKGGECIGGLKGNQSGLLNDVSLCFDDATLKEIKRGKKDYLKTVEKAHSQIEKREFYRIDAYEDPERDKKWGKITSFVCLIKTITPKDPSKPAKQEKRYYISTLNDVAACAEGIREHWLCETGHWFLDTVFREDYNRTMEVNAFQNLSLMMKMVLYLIKLLRVLPQYKKSSLETLRMEIAWNKDKVLADLFSLLNKETLTETLSGVKMTSADQKRAQKLMREAKQELLDI